MSEIILNYLSQIAEEKDVEILIWQLKIIQEVITLSVFLIFTTLLFKNEVLKWNHFAAMICMIISGVFYV
jgi:uncharacterized protein (DUF486 family)